MRTWRTYQLISDAMRENRLLSADFAARLPAAGRRADVPAPRAPSSPARSRAHGRAGSRQPCRGRAGGVDGLRAAAAHDPRADAGAGGAQPEPKPNIVPPTTANDYLLAHQGFSPRISLQGMAPYARTVAEQAVEPRR